MRIARVVLGFIFVMRFLAACGVSTSVVGAPSPRQVAEHDAASDTVIEDASPVSDAVIEDAHSALSVLTASGRIVGRWDGNVRVFQGIPYAAPPVGALRWRPPAPPTPWVGERPTLNYGSICPQFYNGGVRGEEDCLFLNVWTSASPGESRPVMVFLHGGGFSTGSATCDDGDVVNSVAVCDGSHLADHGALVVTLNYRLGMLGFLAEHSLSMESEHQVSGNYGLLDQIAALQWVRSNIAAFGGDPTRVMLFGQSAGGTSVCTHLVSPLSAGLFSRAAIESGNCSLETATLDVAEAQGAGFAEATGCGGAVNMPGCLRAESAADVVLANVRGAGGHKVGPTIDQYFLHATPTEGFATGAYNHVPVLIGSNAEETSIDPDVEDIVSLDQYQSYLEFLFGGVDVSSLTRLYSMDGFTPSMLAGAASSDDWFTCPASRSARSLSREVPVFLYFFARPVLDMHSHRRSAWHGAELLFLFHPQHGADESLAAAMTDYWVHFAATGDVNDPGTLKWPRFSAASPAAMRLDSSQSVMNGVHLEACSIWDSIVMQ